MNEAGAPLMQIKKLEDVCTSNPLSDTIPVSSIGTLKKQCERKGTYKWAGSVWRPRAMGIQYIWEMNNGLGIQPQKSTGASTALETSAVSGTPWLSEGGRRNSCARCGKSSCRALGQANSGGEKVATP